MTTPQPPSTLQGGLQSQKATDLYKYAHETLDPIIQPMIAKLMLSKPEDPVQAMIQYLTELRSTKHQSRPQSASADKENVNTSNQQDIADQLPVLSVDGGSAAPANRRRRAGVSAEPIDATSTEAQKPTRVIPKTDQDRAAIADAIKGNFLFNSLDTLQTRMVVDAMEHKEFRTGDQIIEQGASGDEFYVLAAGTADCYVNGKLVKQYISGESFGELALMYNCQRQATIKAATNVSLWAMDRHTFQTVLMRTTSQKRSKYEEFLSQVPILSTLDKYERSKVADALTAERFPAGATIIRQGDTTDRRFFFLEEGSARAVKRLDQQSPEIDVFKYETVGSYFGELALLSDSARAASVVAGPEGASVVSIDRDSFIRLLGNLEELLKRNADTYAQIEEQLRKSQQHTPAAIAAA